MQPVSGTQYHLESGPYRAVIASVGASIRSLSWNGRDLVRGFAAEEVRPAYRGALLAPWPNRVMDARYEWADQHHQLAITEPARGHALHGLVLWEDFALVVEAADRVALETVIHPQSGYPYRLRIRVLYRLDAAGLHTEVSAHNLGTGTAPFGWGSHSYLVAPGERVDEWNLDLPADTVQFVSADRLVPTGTGMADGTEPVRDFRGGALIAETEIDHAYTSMVWDAAGHTSVSVVDAHGVGARMSWDSRCPWVQIHTGDLPDADLNRRALAVEPMSCPPGAFNSGTDLIALAPGEVSEAWWCISAV